jgi:hypothetical protein
MKRTAWLVMLLGLAAPALADEPGSHESGASRVLPPPSRDPIRELENNHRCILPDGGILQVGGITDGRVLTRLTWMRKGTSGGGTLICRSPEGEIRRSIAEPRVLCIYVPWVEFIRPNGRRVILGAEIFDLERRVQK